MDTKTTTFSSQKFVINGKTYSSLDEVPAEDRERLREFFTRFQSDENGNGIPDVFEGGGSFFLTDGVPHASLPDTPPTGFASPGTGRPTGPDVVHFESALPVEDHTVRNVVVAMALGILAFVLYIEVVPR
jgi:hypothetical protein